MTATALAGALLLLAAMLNLPSTDTSPNGGWWNDAYVINNGPGISGRLDWYIAVESRELLDRLRAERDRVRPKAVPPGRLHAAPELRIARPARRAAARPRAPSGRREHLACRQGAPREQRPARSRRRLRTWERDDAPAVQQDGAAEACWAHNPEVPGSTPGPATTPVARPRPRTGRAPVGERT